MAALHQAILSNFSYLNLVVKITLPSTSGENLPFGERIPTSFRSCTIKVRTENRRKPAPHGVGHWNGEWLEEGRLEQRWELANEILWAVPMSSSQQISADNAGQASEYHTSDRVKSQVATACVLKRLGGEKRH